MAYGAPLWEAFRAVTLYPAQIWGGRRYGSLERGRWPTWCLERRPAGAADPRGARDHPRPRVPILARDGAARPLPHARPDSRVPPLMYLTRRHRRREERRHSSASARTLRESAWRWERMPESLRTRLTRSSTPGSSRPTGGRAGGSVPADDFASAVEVPLTRRPGTTWGRSSAGACTGGGPICMVVLIKTLGPGYVVWDKCDHPLPQAGPHHPARELRGRPGRARRHPRRPSGRAGDRAHLHHPARRLRGRAPRRVEKLIHIRRKR